MKLRINGLLELKYTGIWSIYFRGTGNLVTNQGFNSQAECKKYLLKEFPQYITQVN